MCIYRTWRTLRRIALDATDVVTTLAKKYMKRFSGDAVEESAYKQWEKSKSKSKVNIEWDRRDGSEVLNIGTIEMDLQASCVVMREYIQRNFRDWLNGKEIGNSFQFFIMKEDKEEVLGIADETITYAKDFTLFRIDNETMQGANTATLVPEAEVETWVEIPEFPLDDDELKAQVLKK